MKVIVNPGTGPVNFATADNAMRNMPHLIQDAQLNLSEVVIEPVPVNDHDGRYWYELHFGERTCCVGMPGLPLEQVRFLGTDGQDAWDFPRLYVDGDSWLWKYAVNTLREQLTGEAEEDYE